MKVALNEIEKLLYTNLIRECRNGSYEGNEWYATTKVIHDKKFDGTICSHAKEFYTEINYTFTPLNTHLKHLLTFLPQFIVGKYRIDFLASVEVAEEAEITVGIEIDGHEWHEKTKEQASRDRKRQRDIFSEGIPIIRFTGSEIYNNPKEMAYQIISLVLGYTFNSRC